MERSTVPWLNSPWIASELGPSTGSPKRNIIPQKPAADEGRKCWLGARRIRHPTHFALPYLPEVNVLRRRGLIQKLDRSRRPKVCRRSPLTQRPHNLFRRSQFDGLHRSRTSRTGLVPFVHPVIDHRIAIRQPPGLLQTRKLVAR